MNSALSKIINLMKNKKYQSAELEIKRVVKKHPESFDWNKLFAVNLLWQEKYNSAITIFNKCYNIRPEDYDININLALIFNKIQDYKSSIKFSENAIKINPDRPEAYHNIAESYLYIRDLRRAKEYITKSIELRGGLGSEKIFDFKDTLNIYTDILFSNRDEIKLKKICIDLLNKQIFLGDIFRKLLRGFDDAISKRHIDTLHDVLEKIEDYKDIVSRNRTKANIYSCLAEYNQKINKKLSENYYIKSNELISDIQRSSLYDRQEYAKSMIRFFKDSRINAISKNTQTNLGDGLIFIIGMPRSGTTLTESILSSAEDCIGGGEKVFFVNQCRPIIKQYQNGNIDFESFSELGQRYIDIIEIQRQGKKYFIDKFPENYLYYKFIKTCLPLAKFIHVHRDPWDNAISLFKQFYVKEITYSSSFFGISLEYANYEHIMKQWKKEHNHNILDINYHDLVMNTDATIDDLWKFCEISGRYDNSKRKNYFAQTASKYQVRKDIYSTSLNKDEFIDFKSDFLENLENQRSYWSKL